MLLLSVPFALLARDDWRQQAISLTPSLPWPEWMRTEALRFDRLSMEERRRRRVEGWQKEEAEAELDRLEQSLKGARALMKEEKEWERRQESPEQRETRAAAERERAELERQVAEMEDKVKCLIKRQEEEVTAEVESSEIRLRDSFRSRLAEKAEEVSGALERRLQEAVAVVEREAEAELSGRVGAEVQQAREAELERGVTRINARLQADEEAIQQQAQRMMEEEAQRMAAYYEQEKSRLHPLLDWARAEERAMQTEYAEMRQLHFLSTNIHRLNVLILAIDAALHPPPSPDATAAAPPLTQPWSQLTALARADPVLTVAAESIPPALLSSPPPSFDILQVAFAQLERRLLTAIYSPPPSSSPSLLSHLLAHVFSLLTIPHAQLLPATDDWSRLCRLRWLLYEDAEKDIGRVVAEADGMEGVEARAVLAEWMKPARERAMVEQAVTLVKTRVKALELNMVATTIGEGERP